MRIRFFCFLLMLSIFEFAHGAGSIYVEAIKENTIRLSGPAFKKLWETRGASEREIDAKLTRMASTLADCHEDQFKSFGPKYYNMVVHKLEKGINFDKAFDSGINTILIDIKSGALPSETSQELKSFYLNVGLCQKHKLPTEK